MNHRHYRAFLLGDLRRFDGWSETGGDALTDDSVVYLRDDLTVVGNPVQADQNVVFDTLSPRWREYCHTVLRFEAT